MIFKRRKVLSKERNLNKPAILVRRPMSVEKLDRHTGGLHLKLSVTQDTQAQKLRIYSSWSRESDEAVMRFYGHAPTSRHNSNK